MIISDEQAIMAATLAGEQLNRTDPALDILSDATSPSKIDGIDGMPVEHVWAQYVSKLDVAQRIMLASAILVSFGAPEACLVPVLTAKAGRQKALEERDHDERIPFRGDDHYEW